jgi:hypothetical protein
MYPPTKVSNFTYNKLNFSPYYKDILRIPCSMITKFGWCISLVKWILRCQFFTWLLVIEHTVNKNVFFSVGSTQEIDQRLGRFQKTFKLTGNEVRRLTLRRPKLITHNMAHIKVFLSLAIIFLTSTKGLVNKKICLVRICQNKTNVIN